MSNNSSPSKARILALFFAFTVLFIMVFSLGVFVGKEYSKEELRVTKRFDDPAPTTAAPPGEEIKEDLKIEDVTVDIEAEPDESALKDEAEDDSLSDTGKITLSEMG